jgi:uncharacterized protein YbjT (DUF2867 family)
MKILAIGGTGGVGSKVVQQLIDRGATVHALIRKMESATKLPKNVIPVVGDLLDPETLKKAMNGIDALYLLNAVLPDELTQGLIAIDVAAKVGLKHVVYHSVYKAEAFPEVPHFASKVAIETAIKASEIPFTIIRPNYFMQNDASVKPVLTGPGVYPMPLGLAGISVVDTRDIAEASAIALTSEGHAGVTYNLNGPDLISGPVAADLWSKALGKPIKYPGEDMDAFEAQMRQKAPSWSAFDIRMMLQGYLERGFQAGPDDVPTLTRLLGHAPRTYAAFVTETARAWAAA